MKSDDNIFQIHFFATHWGFENIPLTEFLPRVRQSGFDGLELNLVSWNDRDVSALFELAAINDCKLITMVAGIFDKDYPRYRKTYLENLEYQIGLKPHRINCHTGSDFFSFEQNMELLQLAESKRISSGINIVHEIHRGRFSYSPGETVKYLEALPELRIAADLSHWCVVSESLLENHEHATGMAISRSDHIHSRVGHAESPQVTDPRLPEWQDALNAHLKWWDAIVSAHEKNNTSLSITAEFGPPDYMPTTPFTKAPLADQWDINLYMNTMLRDRYANHL
jgi:hypothetical protein